jgi:hypothetical protein
MQKQEQQSTSMHKQELQAPAAGGRGEVAVAEGEGGSGGECEVLKLMVAGVESEVRFLEGLEVSLLDLYKGEWELFISI